LPVKYLIFPLIRAEQYALLTSRRKAETKPSHSDLPASPGSFFMGAHQFHSHSPAGNGADKASKKKGGKKGAWKREAKKERHKRSV
jgi:hypothetical protein